MTAPVQDSILLLGDSLTQHGWGEGGFAARLADVYVRKLDVVNRGFSGYNTKWAITVLEELIHPSAAQKARLMVIWYGANDAVLPEFPQHVPLADFKANLKSLVAMARGAPCTKDARILLITPPPVSVSQWRKTGISDDRRADQTRKYALAVGEVVQELKHNGEQVGLVDMWTAIWNAAGQEEGGLQPLLSDGLHFTPKGYAVVYETLIAVIGNDLRELHYSNLKETYPLWGDIDYANPVRQLQRRQQ